MVLIVQHGLFVGGSVGGFVGFCGPPLGLPPPPPPGLPPLPPGLPPLLPGLPPPLPGLPPPLPGLPPPPSVGGSVRFIALSSFFCTEAVIFSGVAIMMAAAA